MTIRDDASFSAGQETGTRRSASVARLAAHRLVEGARWWNGWRLRLMARALEACADELEACADELGAEAGAMAGVPA
jgi:hypothetical protein